MQTQLFCAAAQQIECVFGIIFYFIADTDTEKYDFRIVSAMNSDKRSSLLPSSESWVVRKVWGSLRCFWSSGSRSGIPFVFGFRFYFSSF